MPKRIHTRRRRYIPVGNERNRKKRMKTFSSEDAAKKYAESLGLKNFKVVRLNFGLSKKFKIVKE